MADQVDILAQRWESNYTAAIKRIILERLISEELWPPKPPIAQQPS